MREGPDIAHIASLVGDPARANMLTALVGGTALTASELALEAGVTLPTASSHLAEADGRRAAEARRRKAAIATMRWPGRRSLRCWNRSWAWRQSSGRSACDRGRATRRCARRASATIIWPATSPSRCSMDFLAHGVLVGEGGEIRLGSEAPSVLRGARHRHAGAVQPRRPVCRICLDWSVRRSHLAGSLGAAILDKVFAEKWARRESGGRAVELLAERPAGFRPHVHGGADTRASPSSADRPRRAGTRKRRRVTPAP